MHRIAARYARSLLSLAIEQGVLAIVHADMQYFSQMCQEVPALQSLLKHPGLPRSKKQAVLQTLLPTSMQALTCRFLSLVIQRKRSALLPAIAQAFLSQYDQHQGIRRATVTTAIPLSEALALQLQQIAQQIVPCQQVVLTQHVDAHLVGGYILQIEDKRIDQSVRSKLLALKQQYAAAGY